MRGLSEDETMGLDGGRRRRGVPTPRGMPTSSPTGSSNPDEQPGREDVKKTNKQSRKAGIMAGADRSNDWPPTLVFSGWIIDEIRQMKRLTFCHSAYE